MRKYDDFRDLEVWQRCMAIRRKIWALCKKFPADEKYRLRDQMSEIGGQESEIGGQESEIGGQESEIGCR